MSEKKKEGKKKAKGEGEEKDGKSTKPVAEGTDAKSKKDKDVGEGDKKKGGTTKEGDKKSGATKEGDKKGGATNGSDKKDAVATLPVDPDALPPLDAEGNPICAKPDPQPTFAELWFDDPVEGEMAQKMALELRGKIELRALSIRKFLEQAIVPLLLQGLQHMVLERPTNPAEYLAAFLLKNNPLKDVQYVEPPPFIPETVPPPRVEPPKCTCCSVHCPPSPSTPEFPPDFYKTGNTAADKEKLAQFLKNDKLLPTELPKKPTESPKKQTELPKK